MAKYRLLSTAELEELENEFVDYLVLNGIDADEWSRIKRDENPKAEKIVELFSDVVLEGAMRKVQFLELRTQHELMTFQCLPHKIILIGLKAEGETTVNFADEAFISKALQSPPAGLSIYTSEKEYEDVREQELFQMTQGGCMISDGKLFKALWMILASQKQGDKPA